jgi:Ran GTPase-activating protein (RanGAP) involved in mRNA processing and transport
MSVSNNSALTGTVDDGRALLSSTFLDFCSKVRNNDPSILPECGKPFKIRHMREREGMELADALLENTNVTYLQLDTWKYTKSFAEAMAKFVRTSKHLQHISWRKDSATLHQKWRSHEDIFSCFLPAIQDSTSLKELNMELPSRGRPSNLALENMLTHTQSLQSLKLIFPDHVLEDVAMAAVQSGLKKNTTLRELTLFFFRGAATASPILTTLGGHPLLRRLCLSGDVVDLTGLETVLLSETSKITELDINSFNGGLIPMMGLSRVLRALARRRTLTKLGLHFCPLGCDEARLLQTVLCNTPSLQSLALTLSALGSAELAELAPALYHNTSIKVLDLSGNNFNDMESARLLRDIIRCNKTITALDLSENPFGRVLGAVECIADGLGSNSTVLKIDLLSCHLSDDDVSTLAQKLVSQNTTLEKLDLDNNLITSTGVGMLLETMEQNNNSITDLDLQRNPYIGDEGASLLARSLGNNALPNLTRLSLSQCRIDDDGFIALVSALEQNTSLLQLDLRHSGSAFSERAYLALAKSLPGIKVLQRVDLCWCRGLASAMPLLLAGLRENTSLFRFHVEDCAPDLVPPTRKETARCTGGWMQEMECLGYRNRCLTLIRAPKETLPPLGVWPRALARVAILPDAIFEVFRSKPSLVSSEDKGDSRKRTFRRASSPSMLSLSICYDNLDSGIPKKRMQDY